MNKSIINKKEIENFPLPENKYDFLVINELKMYLSLKRFKDLYIVTIEIKENFLYQKLLIWDLNKNAAITQRILKQSLNKKEEVEDFLIRHDDLFSKIKDLEKGEIQANFIFHKSNGWNGIFLFDDSENYDDSIFFVKYIRDEFE